MKPDWKDAPEWAKYLAQDGNGSWWWYLTKPAWNHSRNRWIYGSSAWPASLSDKNPAESLEERP